MTVSLPASLLQKIDAKAEQDGRTRSNWVVKSLEDFFENQGLHSLPDNDANEDRKAK